MDLDLLGTFGALVGGAAAAAVLPRPTPPVPPPPPERVWVPERPSARCVSRPPGRGRGRHGPQEWCGGATARCCTAAFPVAWTLVARQGERTPSPGPTGGDRGRGRRQRGRRGPVRRRRSRSREEQLEAAAEVSGTPQQVLPRAPSWCRAKRSGLCASQRGRKCCAESAAAGSNSVSGAKPPSLSESPSRWRLSRHSTVPKMDTVAAAAAVNRPYRAVCRAQTGGGARRRARTFVKAAAQRVDISKRRTEELGPRPQILPQAFRTPSRLLGRQADHRRPRIPRHLAALELKWIENDQGHPSTPSTDF